MNLPVQIAKHFREVHFGGNWTSSNLRDCLADLSWEEATAKMQTFNTIADLVFHMNYFVSAVLKVLQGGPLNAHDQYSFDTPVIQSQADWESLLEKTWADASAFADLVEKIPGTKLGDDFCDQKYGSYYRNLNGIIEHNHYHLGQIVIIKKMIRESGAH